MTKKRDVKAEHEKAVAKFNAQPAPAIWVCFYWPELHRWQAIAAHELHRPLVEEMRGHLQRMRGGTASEETMAGDALNALAEAVLQQADAPRMGGLLLIVKDHFKHDYLFVRCKRESHGSTVNVEKISAKTIDEARAWVDARPDITLTKLKLVEDVKKGPTQ